MKTDLTLKALDFAEAAHFGSFRADGRTPYVEHPIRVADIVAALGGDEIAVAAALLHDTIEDTPTTAEELAAEFGPTVAAVVTELTFPAGIPNRRAEIVKALPGFSDRAKLIKYADAMANLADLPNSGWDAERLKRHANYAATIITTLYRDVA